MDGHCCESVPHSIAAYWFLLHSIAMAVGILTIPFLILPANYMSSLFTIFQPFLTLVLQFCVDGGVKLSDMPLQIPGMYTS